jgi:prepilin-type N-terminal cleavage/methylation domain-containing protein
MTGRRDGFTIVEVVIAIIMLSIGVLALAGTAGAITRMMSNGQRKTRSVAMASSVIDSLRVVANGNCAALPSSGSGSQAGVSTSWTVSNAGSTGTDHTVTVLMSYRIGPRAAADTLIATLVC